MGMAVFGEKVSREAYIADLHRIHAELGYINSQSYIHHGRYSFSAIKKKFGTWHAACAAAGLESRSYTGRTHHPELETVERLCCSCRKPFPSVKADASHRRCDRCRNHLMQGESIPDGFEYCC